MDIYCANKNNIDITFVRGISFTQRRLTSLWKRSVIIVFPRNIIHIMYIIQSGSFYTQRKKNIFAPSLTYKKLVNILKCS